MKPFGKRARLIAPILLLILVILSWGTGEAGGSGWYVNTTDDTDDGLCDATHCSLREAINIANATPGQQLIAFDIPGVGPHTIELCDLLPAISDSVILNGTLEPDYPYAGGPVVSLAASSGASCAPAPYGLWIEASTSVVTGLSIVGFDQPGAAVSGGIIVHAGSGTTIEANYIGLQPGGAPLGNRNGILLASAGHILQANIISGNTYGVHALAGDHVIDSNRIGTDPDGMATSPALRNTIGIYLEAGADNNLIGLSGTGNIISGNGDGIYIASQGSQIKSNKIGTDRLGQNALGNGIGIHASEGTYTIVGGTDPGETNLISGNITGLSIGGYSTVQGNFIGTDFSGSAAIPNQIGISVQDASYVLIGGTGTGQSNLISGNSSVGVAIHDFTFHIEVLNNKIGTDVTGTGPLGNGKGVLIQGSGNAVGYAATHSGNTIAFNQNEGVLLVWSASQNRVEDNTIHDNGVGIYAMDATTSANPFTENLIYANAALGIDLEPWGVNPNDPGDGDVGANGRLNFPEITSASSTSASGTSCPGCTVEVYVSDLDSSNHGEGPTLIDSIVADGSGIFNVSFMFPLATCDRITATATDVFGNTSEFSTNMPVGLCFVLDPSWFFLIEIIIFIIIWFGARRLGLRGGLTAGPATAAGGAIGVLVTAGVFVMANALPNVELDLTRAHPPEPGVLPPCERFLEPQSLSPAAGASFEDGELPDLNWSVREPLEDDMRWAVELIGPEREPQIQTAASAPLMLAAFGLEPGAEGTYAWRLTGEALAADGSWQPFCNPPSWYHFRLGLPETLPDAPWPEAAPPEPEAPQPSEPEAIGEPEGETEPPMATAFRNATCRAGDQAEYEELGYLLEGESAPIEGRNADSSWWWILNPDWQGHCWVWDGLVEVTGDTSGVPIIAVDPLPETEPEGCMVSSALGAAPVCVVPCPEGARPGTPCEPE